MFDSENAVERVLTVTNYGEDDRTGNFIKTRVTLSPGMIQAIIGSEEIAQNADGRGQHKVNILFVDGNQIELFLTISDLTTVERAVGTYFLN
jgi:prepilin-type processing-associated H-X9-DG protein